jgi:hypothetical protein
MTHVERSVAVQLRLWTILPWRAFRGHVRRTVRKSSISHILSVVIKLLAFTYIAYRFRHLNWRALVQFSAFSVLFFTSCN